MVKEVMGVICGLCFLIGAVIVYELFAAGVTFLVFQWLERKEQKRANKRMERKRK